MYNKNYILTFAIFLLTIAMVNGQVVIGDGLTISKGTTLTVNNQDVVINTDKIAGEGNLNIRNDDKQKITVTENLDTAIELDIVADDKVILGNEGESFALKYLPSLSKEIVLAKAEEKAKMSLPVRYINFEGKSFKIENDKDQNQENQIAVQNNDPTTNFVFIDVLQLKGTTFNFYYNLPIYSVLLNNERFSDYAELYKFQCLTALLKPPTA